MRWANYNMASSVPRALLSVSRPSHNMSLLALVVKPLAYFGLPAYLIHRLSLSSPLARYYIRNILYVCSLSFCSTLGFCSALPLSLVGKRYNVNYVVARTFYTIFSRLSGVHVIVEGEENLEMRPCVFVGNHQTMLDVLCLGSLFPTGTSIMAKKSLKYIPFFGQFMQSAGAVFVDRGNSAVAVRSLQAAGEGMKKRQTSIWVFPEGTRTSRPYHDIRPFKKGAFHLAIQSGFPIVPVVAENYWNLYHKGVFNSGSFRVKVLPPISTKGLTTADAGDLAVRVREQMVQVLREISDPNAPPPPASPEALPASKPKVNPPVDAPAIPKETTPVPSAHEAAAPQSSDVSEERPATPHSEVTSEGSVRRSENDTEEEEGMVMVGRPR
ncbi:1-acylglycerol-3-phosphate O [Gloeopeniophorella convolvens]|nr:1-acylglycerol-3-phosphate O [Gloeopeniophorella convolvens]